MMECGVWYLLYIMRIRDDFSAGWRHNIISTTFVHSKYYNFTLDLCILFTLDDDIL